MKKGFSFITATTIIFLGLGLLPFLNAAVMINEFTVDPQSDWDGSGAVGSSDEFFELFNNGDESVNITGWNLSLTDTTPATQTISGMISPGNYFIILNPVGTQNNNGQLVLINSLGTIVNSVTYGNYDDGSVGDNAPNGNANSLNNECLARLPNGFDSNVDMNDFSKTRCTFSASNNFLTIENQSESSCPIEQKNLSLFMDVSGTDIKQVMVSYTLDGVTSIKNATLVVGATHTYEYTIPGTELPAGILNWHVIVEDNSGTMIESPSRNVTVREATMLVINPEQPDGENGWYVTEPLFSLLSDPSSVQSFYQWDSASSHQYSGPFNLDTLPDGPKESAGILALHYWSVFNDVCGNESMQTSLLHIDLTNPLIKNLKPANNSMVKAHQLIISADIDEIYQGNSGINQSSVLMTLDGSSVPFTLIEHSDDVSVRYAPDEITQGIHTVMVTVEDNAGRTSGVSWLFEINNSLNLTTMIQVYSPENSMVYNRGRIPFNITLDHEADGLRYRDIGGGSKSVFLCRNCMDYGYTKVKHRSFRDGMHTVVIEAIIDGDSSKSGNSTFFIDSKNPSIINAEPRRGFTNGMFIVDFVEENPEELTLSLLFENSSLLTIPLNITESCTFVKNKYFCEINANLSAYDGEEIIYWFTLLDIAGNTDESDEKMIIVDTTMPVINSIETQIDKSRVHFLINVNETNFDSLTYIDLNETNPKEKLLCSKLKNGLCEKTKTFRRGEHTLMIIATDKGGNSVFENILIDIV